MSTSETPALKGTYAEEFGPEFQFHLLAVCARTADFVLRYRSALSHTYFTAALDRLIARALFTHFDAHRVAPHRSTLLEACRVLAPPDDLDALEKALHALFQEDITDRPAVEARAIDFGRTQAMVNAVLAAAEEVDRGERAKVIPLVQAAALVGEDLLDVGRRFADDWTARRAAYLSPRERDWEERIPTGMPHLDHALGGGLKRGELGVVLAPPGRGKTTLLINFGMGALRALAPGGRSARRSREGFNVLHLSLEMAQDDILARYDDYLAGPRHISMKHVQPEQYVAHLDRQQRLVLGDLYVKSYPTRTLTPTKIRSLLNLLTAQGFAPDLLIVDYGDILCAERRLGEPRHEQAGLYEDLRTIAGEYHCVVWTASQAKVGALDKDTITIADFAEAFEKAAIVDCAIGFCQTANERAAPGGAECRLFLAKYRNREDGSAIFCKIRRDCCRILTDEIKNAAGEVLDVDLGPVEVEGKVKAKSARPVETLHAPTGGTVSSTVRSMVGPVKRPWAPGARGAGPAPGPPHAGPRIKPPVTPRDVPRRRL